jgi:hypothetical protein
LVLPGKRATAGHVGWRFRLPRRAKLGRWTARVACDRSSGASRRFTVIFPLPAPMIIVGGVGFTQDKDSGCTTYGLDLSNRSAVVDAVDVTVTEGFQDDGGRSVATDSQDLGGIPAGGTFYIGGETCSNVSLTIARFEIGVKVRRTQPKRYVMSPVSGLYVTGGTYYIDGVGGQLTNPYSTPIPDTATIYVVLHDLSGHIIGGSADRTGAAVAPHKTVGFTIGAPVALGSLAPAQIGRIQASVDPCDSLQLDPCRAVVG